jgi:pimeloyl-ACP methyl ester carboxylesterase
MINKFSKFLLAIAIVYLGLCAVLYFFQNSLIYFPQKASPASGTTTMRLVTEQAELVITQRERRGAKAIIYFGGNAEDVNGSLPTLVSVFPEHAIYLVHYRGYGGSSGSPSELALQTDAKVVFDKLRQEHDSISLVGRSLGSGVATYLASVRPVTRLVLVTPYNSALELAQQKFPMFPISWLLRDKFESWKYAQQVLAPTVLIAAEHDEIIPMSSTRALLENFRQGQAQLLVIRGTGHNTISQKTDYVRALQSGM